MKVVGAAGTVLIGTGCAPVVKKLADTLTPPDSTPTRMPERTPLPIVEQTIDAPVEIPRNAWDIDFVFKDIEVSTVEDGYRKIKNTQVFNNNLEGVIIESPDRNLVIVYNNGLAFDRRGAVNKLPTPWAEDRCVMGSPDKIKALIEEQKLAQNKHVIMVEAQTYAVPGGAEWELTAYGGSMSKDGGIQPQRFLQTNTDAVRAIAP